LAAYSAPKAPLRARLCQALAAADAAPCAALNSRQ